MEQRDVAMRYANKRFNYSTRRAEETGRFLFDSLKLPPITGRAMYPRAESPADFKKEKSIGYLHNYRENSGETDVRWEFQGKFTR